MVWVNAMKDDQRLVAPSALVVLTVAVTNSASNGGEREMIAKQCQQKKTLRWVRARTGSRPWLQHRCRKMSLT
jgi:hypothetical protein